jgi:deazaflavin-dependent oxidoreductase (nitroreductase family)
LATRGVDTRVPTQAQYEPSPWDPVAQQVTDYEASGGTVNSTLEGKPLVILTTTGAKTGKLRKTPLMRVEHDGEYVVIASLGGAPMHPQWYLNVLAHPDVTLQDGDRVMEMRARTATPEEKARWWPHAVEAWPPYADYQASTDRDIPVVILEPR